MAQPSLLRHVVYLKGTFGLTQDLHTFHWCTCSNVGARSELSVRAEKTQHPAQAVPAPESIEVAWLSDFLKAEARLCTTTSCHWQYLCLAPSAN